MIDTVLFDLDGTLLPMDLDEFIKFYFKKLLEKMTTIGYDAKVIRKGVLEGTNAMIQNQGNLTNENVFWNTFCEHTGIAREDCESDFDDFYRDEFDAIGACCEQSEAMIRAVQILHAKGYRLLLTTNPLFPKIAVEKRIQWAGLKANVFSLITSYEDFHYTKPNIGYYKEVIELENLTIENCMMVGNDSLEDGVIETLGIPLYLIEDHLIHREDTPLQCHWHGTSTDFLKKVETMPDLRKETK